MRRPYQAAIAQYLPHARHLLDRFHVVRWFTEGLTQVRRDLQRRDPDHTPPAYEPDLFRARFALLRRSDNLSDAHRAHRDRLFAAHPRLKVAWDAVQELYQIYSADDLQAANEALARFADLYDTGQTPRIPRHRRQDHFLRWKRTWPTTPAGERPTAPSKAPTTSSRCYDASLTGSPTMTTTPPAGILVT